MRRNGAYTSHKYLHVSWTGIRYSATQRLDLTGAFYGCVQEAYGRGDLFGCTGTQSSACQAA